MKLHIDNVEEKLNDFQVYLKNLEYLDYMEPKLDDHGNLVIPHIFMEAEQLCAKLEVHKRTLQNWIKRFSIRHYHHKDLINFSFTGGRNNNIPVYHRRNPLYVDIVGLLRFLYAEKDKANNDV